MAVESNRVKVTLRTPRGYEFSYVFHVAAAVISPTDPVVLAVVDAINALTAGWPYRIEISISAGHTGTPVSAAVYLNEDKAESTFVDDMGGAHTYKLPGIVNTLVSTDGVTVPDSGLYATFLAAVASHGLGPAGESLTAPSFGKRRTARKQLKK